MKKKSKTTRNWSEYTKKKIQNGSLNFWIDEACLRTWDQKTLETGEPGRPFQYPDALIQFCLILRFVYQLPLRQTQGFVQSLFHQWKIPWKCPSYSQLCRRSQTVKLPPLSKSCGKPMVIALDSTGLKIYGEGEWKVRQHGVSYRRTWRKLHIAIDTQTGHIRAHSLTGAQIYDGEVCLDLLTQIKDPLVKVLADGGYDDKKCYTQIQEKGALPVIPPDKNAQIQTPASKTYTKSLKPRDQALVFIQKAMFEKGISHEDARKLWRQTSGYHQRSKVETTFYRFKAMLGGSLRSRLMESQKTEAALKCLILNRMLSAPT